MAPGGAKSGIAVTEIVRQAEKAQNRKLTRHSVLRAGAQKAQNQLCWVVYLGDSVLFLIVQIDEITFLRDNSTG